MKNYYDINYENNMQMLSDAINYCEKEFNHEDIIRELYSDNDIKKQLCIINLKTINSKEEAKILADNLINQSGPIREVTSFKISELISCEKYTKYFNQKGIIDILIKGITDINPSVSRNTIESIKYITDTDYLIKKIITEINITLNNIEDIKQTRSYTTNKKNFNLYWNLEALINLSNKIVIDENIVKIIKTTYKSNDYTIREKTAKLIISLNKNNLFEDIINILKNDKNMYVNKYFS